MKRHLLICGERGVGKSTLIRRLLKHSTREVGGFVTKRLPIADENGFFPIYLYPASQKEDERHNEAANLVGTCDSRSPRSSRRTHRSCAPCAGMRTRSLSSLTSRTVTRFLKSSCRTFCGGMKLEAASSPCNREEVFKRTLV